MASSLLGASRRVRRSFFNRADELLGLRMTMTGDREGDGKLLLVTGPPNSGKSALLQEFVDWQRESKKGFPILINMRSGTFNSAASFSRELKKQAKSWCLPAFFEICGSVLQEPWVKERVNKPAGGPLADALKLLIDTLKTCLGAVESTDETDMQALLSRLEALFLSWHALLVQLGHGMEAGKPTLIIDEANRLHEWCLTPDEQQNLATLQAWITMITKEKGIANAILCSSEDFFRFWMNSQLGSERYLVGVVGDLTEEEALEFFRQRLLLGRPEKFATTYELPDGLWKEVYDRIGGRMSTLKLLADQLAWVLEDEGQMRSTWMRFWEALHSASLSQMFAACTPHNLPAKWTRHALGARLDAAGAPPDTFPLWTVQEYIELLKSMAAAECGVVSEFTLVRNKVISKEALYSLIQHNFLHFREVGYWGGKDLKWYTGKFPVIMPTSRPSFHTIKEVLAEVEKQPSMVSRGHS